VIVALLDCGSKGSIARSLLKYGKKLFHGKGGIEIRIIPCRDAEMLTPRKGESPWWDGLVIGSGPGDPSAPFLRGAVGAVRRAMLAARPTLGICLGHQLMALAAGGSTYKLPYGHRGTNTPVWDEVTGRGYVSSSNHGYAVQLGSLPAGSSGKPGWKPYFTHMNDKSLAGMYHSHHPLVSVQFHPEAHPGPTDLEWIIESFVERVGRWKGAPSPVWEPETDLRGGIHGELRRNPRPFPRARPGSRPVYRKVLLLGSGAIQIGQAGEFDFAGSQALKALREEGVPTVLVNPNVASVQTAPGSADEVYSKPLTARWVEAVIVASRPDAILLSFGGQARDAHARTPPCLVSYSCA